MSRLEVVGTRNNTEKWHAGNLMRNKPWKEPVVLLDVPFRPNVELMRAMVTSTPETKMKKVFAQNWEESERGWGVRPDGVTLHATLAKMNEYKKKFFSSQPGRSADGSAPDEYTRESGEPYEIEVDETLYKQVVAAGFALHASGITRGKDTNGFTTWTVHLYQPVPVQPASREELVEFLRSVVKTIVPQGNAGLLADIKKILDKETQ